jgi:peptidoglycan/xylan/chitin deacetylase (PgdA/CDA1 family)
MADHVPANTPPTGEVRSPGMDHAHYPFRTLPDAPHFAWPDGARIALTVTLMLDYWELEPRPGNATPDPRIVSPLGKFFPDWLTWSHREYGARVGIFRVLDVLDRFGLTPSVALGSAAAQRYPELVDELMRRNACFMAHGSHATRRITSRMTGAEERAFIAEARDAVAAATGATPVGWCGQDFNESAHTPALLAEAGFAYTTDWPNDDRPYWLGPYDGRHLLALPPQPEWNDLECMWLRRVSAPVWADGIAEAFAMLHDEGGGAFNLTLHPWIAGQAHRIRYLRDAMQRILGKPGIWRTTTDELARVASGQAGG